MSCTSVGWHDLRYRVDIYSLTIAAVYTASDSWIPYKRVSNTGPFASYIIQNREDYETVLGVIRQSLTVTNTETTDMDGTSGPGYGVGHNDLYEEDVYAFTFETPIGELTPLTLVGNTHVWYEHCASGGTVMGIQWTGKKWEQVFSGPEWGGIGSLAYPKNEVTWKYASNVMFQIHYYSANVNSMTLHIPPNYVDAVDPGPDTYFYVWSPTYTSVVAALQYYPDQDAEEADPMTMVRDSLFEDGIMVLFDAAMTAGSGSPITHFDAKVYN
jgi:hypothetical protein